MSTFSLARASLARSWKGVRPTSSLASEASSTSTAAAPPPPTTPSASSPSTSTATDAPLAAKNSPSPSALQHAPTGALSPHTPIPPKHGVHVATLHLRSHTTSLQELTFFTSFALRAARALGLPTTGAVALPTKTSLFTVPRSPFAHKKSQQNFWRKEHKRAIKVYDGNEEIVRAWLAFLRAEAMGGVGQKAMVYTYREVGWGTKLGEDDGDALRSEGIAPATAASGSSAEDSAALERLAEELQRELEAGVAETEESEVELGQVAGEGARRELEEATAEQPVAKEAAAEPVKVDEKKE